VEADILSTVRTISIASGQNSERRKCTAVMLANKKGGGGSEDLKWIK